MSTGILGKKIGMTQVFGEGGERISVTLLETGTSVVQAVKNEEHHGYNAVQLGFDDTKEMRIKKPQREYLKAKGLKPKRFVREIKCDEAPEAEVGDKLTNSIFQKGDFVDITGISKGKGFQGGMKRCGWVGGGETHGSMSHRAPGSIGASSFPSKVEKGHPMPGHMGNEMVTVQNLEVVVVDKEAGTIGIKGAVPGTKSSFLIIRFAKKKPFAPREVREEQEAEEAKEQGAAEKEEPEAQASQ